MPINPSSNDMKAIVIQNAENTPVGLVGSVLETSYGFDLSICHAAKTDFAAISPRDADLFVILGSPKGVYERKIDWIEAEYEFTARLTGSDTPVLGICFGGQMLASALGAEVKPMGERHLGWHVNEFTANAAWQGPWFRWHGDTFALPEGARLLASSAGVCQGFQHGRAVGLQFHPEVDHTIVRGWAVESPDVLKSEGVDLDDFVKEALREEQGARQRLGRLMEDVMHRCLG